MIFCDFFENTKKYISREISIKHFWKYKTFYQMKNECTQCERSQTLWSAFFTCWQLLNCLSSPFSPELEDQEPRFKTRNSFFVLFHSTAACFPFSLNLPVFLFHCFLFSEKFRTVSVTFLMSVLSLRPRLHQDILFGGSISLHFSICLHFLLVYIFHFFLYF